MERFIVNDPLPLSTILIIPTPGVPVDPVIHVAPVAHIAPVAQATHQRFVADPLLNARYKFHPDIYAPDIHPPTAHEAKLKYPLASRVRRYCPLYALVVERNAGLKYTLLVPVLKSATVVPVVVPDVVIQTL